VTRSAARYSKFLKQHETLRKSEKEFAFNPKAIFTLQRGLSLLKEHVTQAYKYNLDPYSIYTVLNFISHCNRLSGVRILPALQENTIPAKDQNAPQHSPASLSCKLRPNPKSW